MRQSKYRRFKFVLLGAVLVSAGFAYGAAHRINGLPFSPWQLPSLATGAAQSAVGTDRALLPESPSKMATWPLPGATQDNPHQGVTHWLARDSDGTSVDFFDFDFAANPKLRWAIFDQDTDDEKPFDNSVKYFGRSAARFAKEFNAKGEPKVVAAWNGAFFGYSDPQKTIAFHVSPVVLAGKVRFNVAQHRWTFGVKYGADGRPNWKVLFKPTAQELAQNFDFAAGSVQCLIKNGKPLKMEPFPKYRSEIKKQPVPSTAADAGHIPFFDHMKTCRDSIGWSRDNRHLYLLIVKEPDFEAGSSIAFSQGIPGRGGWTVADVQRFWLKQGAWGAINSDAGDVGQVIYRDKSGYTYVPPRQASGEMRVACRRDWKNVPSGGGAMMYFYVSDLG